MATTTNYGWTTPDDTDLVKDGAAAIRTLGSSVDTTTKALNPSTTQGDIEYRSATANTNSRLAIGTAGQILTVNAGATAPEWVTPASAGGLTLLSTTSLTGASTTVSSISGSYKNLIIFVKDFNASGATLCLLGVNSDNTAANYVQTVSRATGSTNGPFADNTSPGAFIVGHTILAAMTDAFAAFTIPDYANATTKKTLNGYSSYTENSNVPGVTLTTCAYGGAVAAVTELNFKVSSGTWSAGSVEIYGQN